MRIIYAWNPDYTWVIDKDLWKHCQKRIGEKPEPNTEASDEYWRKVAWLYKLRGGKIKEPRFDRRRYRREQWRKERERRQERSSALQNIMTK
jgi:hypothetical protein